MIIFKQRKHMHFRQNADNLRLVKRLTSDMGDYPTILR